MKAVLKTTLDKKILGQFEWTRWAEDITADDAATQMLVKGVAATTGEKKDGSNITRDDLIAGTGAMRAMALKGEAKINVDHYPDELPPEYQKKYGLKNGMIGKIKDCHYIDTEIDGKQVTVTEFVAELNDKKAYEMVKEGKFPGCSVESITRGMDCDEKQCSHTGSVMTDCALILDEVPNRHGTWVSQVTKDDIGTILIEKKTTDSLKRSDKLDEYIQDGKWKDGEKGAIKFFEKFHKMEKSLADELGKFVHSNPTILTQYQLENMSRADLDMWFKSYKYQQDMQKKIKVMEDRLKVQEKNTRRILTFDYNKKQMKTYLKIIGDGHRYGQSEVGYTNEAAEDKCIDCRWFAPTDPENPEGVGECSEVADEIRGTGGCTRFDRNPATPEEEEPAPEGEPGEEMEEEDPLMESSETQRIPEGYPRADKQQAKKIMLDANKIKTVMLENEYDRLAIQPPSKYTLGRMADIRDEFRQMQEQTKKKTTN